MSFDVQTEGRVMTIQITGAFDYTLYSRFKRIFEIAPDDMQYILDMGQVDHIDSSGMGMLLVLKESTDGQQERVKLIHTPLTIRAILERVQMHHQVLIQ
ncbi:STAS domain-containing protein [Magnetococcus sp. PR-3]|uniref:STAS domain-containing protein n=1 Tax=Magnetococcus sp. PR-3 TaxID=3120355 RepID=UPI002FCDFA59